MTYGRQTRDWRRMLAKMSILPPTQEKDKGQRWQTRHQGDRGSIVRVCSPPKPDRQQREMGGCTHTHTHMQSDTELCLRSRWLWEATESFYCVVFPGRVRLWWALGWLKWSEMGRRPEQTALTWTNQCLAFLSTCCKNTEPQSFCPQHPLFLCASSPHSDVLLDVRTTSCSNQCFHIKMTACKEVFYRLPPLICWLFPPLINQMISP